MSLKLDKTHAHFEKMIPTWQKLRAAISGEGIAQYLSRHPRESAEAFFERRRSTTWRNFPRQALAIWTSNLLKKQPSRELPPALAELVPDVDKQGTPAGLFFKRVIEQALVYGVSFVQVDLPAVDNPKAIKTVAQAQAAGIRPYMIARPPTDVLDWDHDANGALRWVALRDSVETDPQPMVENEPIEAVLILYPAFWEQWISDGDGKIELIDSGEYSFGQVPLVPFYAKRLGLFQGESPMVEITGLALELMQAQSLLGIALGHTGLPRLVIHGSEINRIPLVTGTGQGGLRVDHNEKASYLYLPSDAVKALQIEVDRLKADIRSATYHQLDQRKESALRESAEKRRLDMSALHSALASWADNFQDSENLVWQIMAKGCPDPRAALGKTSISYQKKFDLRSNSERLEEAIAASTLSVGSPTFERELHTQLAKALLEDASPETLQKVADEIAAHAEF